MRDPILLNEDIPTFGTRIDLSRSVLDLVFVSTSLADMIGLTVLNESFNSDHFSVTFEIPLRFERICESSNRLRLREVNWEKFEDLLTQAYPIIMESENCIDKYISLTGTIVKCLKDAGAYIPGKRKSSSPMKPSWWTEECGLVIQKKSKISLHSKRFQRKLEPLSYRGNQSAGGSKKD